MRGWLGRSSDGRSIYSTSTTVHIQHTYILIFPTPSFFPSVSSSIYDARYAASVLCCTGVVLCCKLYSFLSDAMRRGRCGCKPSARFIISSLNCLFLRDCLMIYPFMRHRSSCFHPHFLLELGWFDDQNSC